MLLRFVCFAAVLTASSPAIAIDAYSVVPSCAFNDNDLNVNYLSVGECYGTIQAIFDMQGRTQYKTCIPVGVTIGQAGLIIQKYAGEHPEQLHYSFTYFAIIALQKAFPCLQ